MFDKLSISVDPKDRSIDYKWFDVGMLDYDAANQLYLVQKVNSAGRVVDDKGHAVVNGGCNANGKFVFIFTIQLNTSS